MDTFEKQMEDMGVKAAVMEDSLGTVSGSAVNQNDVNGLLKQVADERGLQLTEDMNKQLAPTGSISASPSPQVSAPNQKVL
jgi:hypothetical protein